jgi:hypothetical protein
MHATALVRVTFEDVATRARAGQQLQREGSSGERADGETTNDRGHCGAGHHGVRARRSAGVPRLYSSSIYGSPHGSSIAPLSMAHPMAPL